MFATRQVSRALGLARPFSLMSKFARESVESTLGSSAFDTAIDAENWLLDGWVRRHAGRVTTGPCPASQFD